MSKLTGNPGLTPSPHPADVGRTGRSPPETPRPSTTRYTDFPCRGHRTGMISDRHLGVEWPGCPAVGRRHDFIGRDHAMTGTAGPPKLSPFPRTAIVSVRYPRGFGPPPLSTGNEPDTLPDRRRGGTRTRPPLPTSSNASSSRSPTIRPSCRSRAWRGRAWIVIILGHSGPNPRLAGGQGVADRGRPRRLEGRGYRGLHHEGAGQDDPVAVPPGRPPVGPIPGRTSREMLTRRRR